jgi:hypothetical protein
MDKRHGGPYDRGSADSYYRRGINPHYYKGRTGYGEKVVDLSAEEVNEYMTGYLDNEKAGDFKNWD